MVKLEECAGSMFWGVTIDSGKKYSQTVKQAFHVSMAALDLNGKKSSENVQVMLQHDSSEFLLCTLNDKILQQSLDLNFETGEELAFSLNGAGVVHLSGYLALGDEEFDEESLSGSDEEVPSLVETPDSAVAAGNKRKKSLEGSTPKKIKLSTSSMLEEADSEDDEDDDDFSDDFDEDEFPDEDDSDVDSEDDDEDEEDEEDEDDEDDEDEEFSTPVQQVKTPKSAEKGKVKENKNTPKQALKKESKTPQQSTPAGKKSETEKPTTPATPENGESSKKKKKKKKKKNKDGDSSMNDSTASTPAQTPKTETTQKKRVVAGGTIVEDMKVGHGPEAKPGKMVSVYYVGTLAKNQKRFDSCQGGKPFRFRLNQGEVIKGWDNGVNGMKVGGKRKITVPANQGYGNVKQGPIPPNSTLVFEVELKAVN